MVKTRIATFVKDLVQSTKSAQCGLRIRTWRFKYLGWSAFFYDRHSGSQTTCIGWQINAGIVAITYGV